MKTTLVKILSGVISLLGTITFVSQFLNPTVSATVVTPRLIVTGSDIDSDSVKAGDDFNLVIHMKNESTSKLTNIKLTLSTADNEIVPKSGSDSIYVDSVAKEESFDVEVEMSSRKDLDPKTYSIALSYSYEEGDWRSFEDSATIPVSIIQIPSLSITELTTARSSIVNEGKTSCSLNVNNTGKCVIRNVTVSLEGENIVNTETFVGKLELDESKTVDMSIKAASLGEGDVNVKVTYEDNEGNVYTEKDTLKINVVEPVVEVPVVKAPFYMNPIVWAVAGGVLVIFIVSTIIRKKREKAYA